MKRTLKGARLSVAMAALACMLAACVPPPEPLMPAGIGLLWAKEHADFVAGGPLIETRSTGSAPFSGVEPPASTLYRRSWSAGFGPYTPFSLVTPVNGYAGRAMTVTENNTGTLNPPRSVTIQTGLNDCTFTAVVNNFANVSDLPQVFPSPDGTKLAVWYSIYDSDGSSGWTHWIKIADASQPNCPTTDVPTNMSGFLVNPILWAPDSSAIAFDAGGGSGLDKFTLSTGISSGLITPVTGNPYQSLRIVYGWTADDRIIFANLPGATSNVVITSIGTDAPYATNIVAIHPGPTVIPGPPVGPSYYHRGFLLPGTVMLAITLPSTNVGSDGVQGWNLDLIDTSTPLATPTVLKATELKADGTYTKNIPYAVLP